MKKLAFSLVLVAGALSVKAQVAPSEKNKNAAPDTTYSYKRGPFIAENMSVGEVMAKLKNKAYSTPVVQLPGNSKMPVITTDQTGYTMPVAGKKNKGLYYMKKDSVTKGN